MQLRKRDVFASLIVQNDQKHPAHKKCIVFRLRKRKGLPLVVGFAVDHIRPGEGDGAGGLRIQNLLQGLGRRHEPVMIAVPGSVMTFRPLQVPTQQSDELMQIAGLQAAKILPYTSKELLTCVQVISRAKKGYSSITLGVALRKHVDRGCSLIRQAGVTQCVPVSYSFGLCAFFTALYPHRETPACVVEVDGTKAEIIVVRSKKLLVSRSVSLSGAQGNWQGVLIDQIRKTMDMCRKEGIAECGEELFILGPAEFVHRSSPELAKQLAVPVRRMPYDEVITASEEMLLHVKQLYCAIAGIIGLGIDTIPVQERLLSGDERRVLRMQNKKRKAYRLWICGMVAAFLFVGSGFNYAQHKRLYKEDLVAAVARLGEESESVYRMQQRLDALAVRSLAQDDILNIITLVSEVMPADTVLTGLTYESGRTISLRGHTQQFGSVGSFISQLKAREELRDFVIQVTYATRTAVRSSEAIGFEIMCQKREPCAD